jgi:hypothetical protein
MLQVLPPGPPPDGFAGSCGSHKSNGGFAKELDGGRTGEEKNHFTFSDFSTKKDK